MADAPQMGHLDLLQIRHSGCVSWRRLEAGREFLADLSSGDHPELLDAYFKARVRERNLAFSQDEVYTSGLFDDLVQAVDPPVAFDLITPATTLALEWRSGSLFDLALMLVAEMARASHTTEIPGALDVAWPALAATVDEWETRKPLEWRVVHEMWEALVSHYRRRSPAPEE